MVCMYILYLNYKFTSVGYQIVQEEGKILQWSSKTYQAHLSPVNPSHCHTLHDSNTLTPSRRQLPLEVQLHIHQAASILFL